MSRHVYDILYIYIIYIGTWSDHYHFDQLRLQKENNWELIIQKLQKLRDLNETKFKLGGTISFWSSSRYWVKYQKGIEFQDWSWNFNRVINETHFESNTKLNLYSEAKFKISNSVSYFDLGSILICRLITINMYINGRWPNKSVYMLMIMKWYHVIIFSINPYRDL